MLEIRLRVLQAGPRDFLGIVEGFPQVLGWGPTAVEAEADTVRGLEQHLESLMDQEATRIQWDDYPTIRSRCLWFVADAILPGRTENLPSVHAQNRRDASSPTPSTRMVSTGAT